MRGASRSCRGRRHEELRAAGQGVGAFDPRKVTFDRGDPFADLADRLAERAAEKLTTAGRIEVPERVGHDDAALLERLAGYGVERLTAADAKGQVSLSSIAAVGRGRAVLADEFDRLEPDPRDRSPLEASAPERAGSIPGGGACAHGLAKASTPCPVEDPDSQSRDANEVHGLARYANLEERDLAAPQSCDSDALHISPTELGLHLSRGAIA